MKVIAVAMLCVCAVACSANPTAPSAIGTAKSTPLPIGRPAITTWILSGSVMNTLTRQPISEAHLSGFDVTTSSDGAFTAKGSGFRSTQPVTIDAPGYVTRQTTIDAGATAPRLDLFPASSLDFYRQMVRNGLEQPGSLQPVRRWTRAPQFYINQNGNLSPEDLRRIMWGIQIAVSQLTNLWPVRIAVGPPREDLSDWVTIAFVNQPGFPHCGIASVGSNPGHIDVNLKTGCQRLCADSQVITALIAHEVGHSLGFWHVNQGMMNGVVFPADACRDTTGFTTAERQAAQIAYTRPLGNNDPDADAPATRFLGAELSEPITVID